MSVVIPTYNRSALLPDAIRPVFRQDYRSIEVIVINDGSTSEEMRRFTGRVLQIKNKHSKLTNSGEGSTMISALHEDC